MTEPRGTGLISSTGIPQPRISYWKARAVVALRDRDPMIVTQAEDIELDNYGLALPAYMHEIARVVQ